MLLSALHERVSVRYLPCYAGGDALKKKTHTQGKASGLNEKIGL